MAETGKAREDAMLVEVAYGANALGFWPRKAPKWLADEKVRTFNPFVLGRKMVVRYRRARRRRRDRALELPARQLASVTPSQRSPRATPSSSSHPR